MAKDKQDPVLMNEVAYSSQTGMPEPASLHSLS